MIKRLWYSLLSNDKPQDKNVIWIDTSNSESFTLKLYRNGGWKPLQVVGTSRDMIERELTGYVTSHYHSYDRIINKPTTLEGYGITDCFNKKEVEKLLDNKVTKVDGMSLTSNNFSDKYKKILDNLSTSYYDKGDIDNLFNNKQDIISDLDSIREGAKKGSTALQSFTETDPIYLKDKPFIALKSDLLNDNNLVHKEGDEDIKGSKWFEYIRTDNFDICQGDNSYHSVYIDYHYDEDNYLPILHFGSEEDWLTILDNIADPVYDFHAANKHYVDTILSNFIAEWEITSYEEILENYNKGRHIYLSIYNGSDFIPLSHYETGYGFYFNYNGEIYLIAKAEEEKYQIETNYNFISLDRDQTVYGVKTFNSSPIAPSPNNDNEVANKSYVDQIVSTKQDIISDLNTIRTNAEKGATALQSYTETDPIYTADKPNLALKSEIPDISGLATKIEVASKQDTISDLETIRSNANKGATALQSESDPIYMADKPSIALKTTIVTETEGSASYAISPNVLTKLGTLASSVTLSLDTSKEESGVTNVYDIIFTTPTNAPSITWPEGILWVGGSAPVIAGGKTYEVNIMDNLATYGEF